MTYYFDSINDAKEVALGFIPAVTIAQYFEAWQYLYDTGAELSEPDIYYLDKLICDGTVLTKENYDELNGIAHYPSSPGEWREASLSDSW